MKSLGIRIKYKDAGGKNIMEEYDSLNECSIKYDVSIPTLRKVIEGKGKDVTKNMFPLNSMFEIVGTPIKKPRELKYKCETCNIEVIASSKYNHLRSHRHKKNLLNAL